jgi:hypothetical protein
VQNEDVGRCSFVLMTDKERLNLSQIFLFRHRHPSSGYNKFNFFRRLEQDGQAGDASAT